MNTTTHTHTHTHTHMYIVEWAIFSAAASEPATLRNAVKLIKEAGSVLGPLQLVVERRMLHKLLNIMVNTTHTLHTLLVRQHTHTHTHTGTQHTHTHTSIHIYTHWHTHTTHTHSHTHTHY